ncbi:putative Na+/H+ antiporter [Bdellovibrionota bacterium FG-2]
MNPSLIQWLALIIFGLAVSHTFLVKRFQHWAHQYREGSVPENFFHLLGEVEIVFGLWAAVLILALAALSGPTVAIQYLESRNFTEPAFVFVVLSLCSTRPILELAERLISALSKLLPFKRPIAFFATALAVGPILGSFITEPAAMTVTALLLLDHFFGKEISTQLKYATLGALFVNVSIGGTLTPYAAPPVLMVAGSWGWGLKHMFLNFGWKGATACIISAAFVAIRFKKEINTLRVDLKLRARRSPLWVQAIHLLFLIATVAAAHSPTIVIGLFLFFLGFTRVTSEHQEPIQLRQGLLVSFFLAGLVVIGGQQNWWLGLILGQLSTLSLYLGAIVLTAFTDNAALTYLGSLVPTLSDSSRYALVAGAVVGGGLTVIANAPNPAGYSILNPSFGEEGISPLGLFRAALIPTAIAGTCFWLL